MVYGSFAGDTVSDLFRIQGTLSRLPPKSVPLLARVAFGVTSLLAIANPLFIFHLFCLWFYTPGFNSPITCSLFNPLFSPWFL